MGYSLSFVLIKAEERYGWRAVNYISGVPGIVLGVIMLLTVKEPTRGGQEGSNAVSSYVLLVNHSQCKQTSFMIYRYNAQHYGQEAKCKL